MKPSISVTTGVESQQRSSKRIKSFQSAFAKRSCAKILHCISNHGVATQSFIRSATGLGESTIREYLQYMLSEGMVYVSLCGRGALPSVWACDKTFACEPDEPVVISDSRIKSTNVWDSKQCKRDWLQSAFFGKSGQVAA